MCFKSYEQFHSLTTAGWTDTRPSKKVVTHAGDLIENVYMYMYATFDQNIPCGSRGINELFH